MAFTLGRDVIVPFLKARDIDHLHYRNLGKELPLFDVVPLSRTTHRIVTILRKIPVVGNMTNLALRMAYTAWLGLWIVSGLEMAALINPAIPHPTIQSFATVQNYSTKAYKNLVAYPQKVLTNFTKLQE